jgi:hypothetical protein
MLTFLYAIIFICILWYHLSITIIFLDPVTVVIVSFCGLTVPAPSFILVENVPHSEHQTAGETIPRK